MNLYWVSLGLFTLLSAYLIYTAYKEGIEKVVKRLLTTLIPLILAGTAVRIGNVLLPSANNISYMIAGLGTILFYIILTPILQKEESDRYRKISKHSRIIACFIAVIEAWLIVSFIAFFINIFYPIHSKTLELLMTPINIIWFFPQNMVQ